MEKCAPDKIVITFVIEMRINKFFSTKHSNDQILFKLASSSNNIKNKCYPFDDKTKVFVSSRIIVCKSLFDYNQCLSHNVS